MLYKFKSKASGDVIMLEATGRKVLQILGKEPIPRGILTPDQLEPAIDALQRAVDQEEADLADAKRAALAEGKSTPGQADISLRQRATPFVAMLKRSHAENESVVWGV